MFPAGKLSLDESGLGCAIRGFREEVDFDVSLIVRSNQFLENNIYGRQVSVQLKYFTKI